MKAVQCVEWGPPEKLVVADIEIPEPKPGEVRVRVAAAGVNFPDALIVQKKYQVQPPLPFTPGTEVAGSIDKVGEGVGRLKPGDRVIAFVGIGGFAEYVCAPAALVACVPAGVSNEVAAAFTLTYATSHHALFDRGALRSGETLLVLGAGGGVGLSAVELGKIAGARVIAAASSAAKLQAAREHGADVLIDYSRQDLREAVKAATEGKGVDVVYDPVGGPLTEAAIRSLAWRGRLLVIGFAQGEIPQIPASLLLIKGVSAVGVYWGDFAKREPKANGVMLTELFGWLAGGKLRPHVSKTFSLQDVPVALRSLLDRAAVGKLVVVPAR
jgi:NADPH2:quinone reductase